MPENAGQFYTGDAGRAYHCGKRDIPDAAFPWVARLRAEKFVPWVRPGDAVFEFGAGWGWNLAALRCREKSACDISETVVPALKTLGIRIAAGPGDISSSSQDTVICHHVLEHVDDPAAALREMRRILKPDGRLLLFVPFETERRYRRFDPKEPNHHLFSWNVQTLGNLTESAGFSVVQAGTGRFGYDRFAAAWSVKLGGGERGFRLIRALLHAVRPGREVRLTAIPRRNG